MLQKIHMKKKISFTPENLKDSYFNLDLMFRIQKNERKIDNFY